MARPLTEPGLHSDGDPLIGPTDGERKPWEWDHNAWYHALLLRQLPPRPEAVLDLGCGSGLLAQKLSERAHRVDTIDPDAAMCALTRAHAPRADVIQGDFLTTALPRDYDAVVCVSALHHLPLPDALQRVDEVLRPGGIFAAIGIPRHAFPRELPHVAVTLAAQYAMSAGILLARSVTARPILAKRPEDTAMPVKWPPEHTTAQIAEIADRVLPGAAVRRLRFWRYLLTWRKPD